MKSFLKGLCLLLALMSTTGLVVAKEGAATSVDKAELSNKVVNLNKADANTLRYYLKGIGEVKAEAIIQYRKENGKFSSAKDLLKVPGIGDATFDGLKKNVSTSRGETTAPKLATSGNTSKRKTSSTKSSKKSSLLDKSDDKSDSKSDAKKATKKSKTSKKPAAKKSAKCDPAKDKDCKAKVSKKSPKAKKSLKPKKASSKSKSTTKKPKSKAKKTEKSKKKKKADK